MAYTDHFQLADDLITHLDAVVESIVDPFITSRYVGFVSVSAATVYELAIKEIFIDFAQKKHKVFGVYAESYFRRLNGRIKTGELRNTHIPRFGDRYVKRYRKMEEAAEKAALRDQGLSILAAYNNLIEWRNQFAHQGRIPTTATYAEVTGAYQVGKEIIHCLARAMTK